jgi:prefoldin subunit 5
MTIEERVEFLTQSIESHDRQLGVITESLSDLKDAIKTLVKVTNEDATAIRTLARIADAHEHRIRDIEGRS